MTPGLSKTETDPDTNLPLHYHNFNFNVDTLSILTSLPTTQIRQFQNMIKSLLRQFFQSLYSIIQLPV